MERIGIQWSRDSLQVLLLDVSRRDVCAAYQGPLRRLNPTAVIVLEIVQLLSLYSHCTAAGIRIPRELSVALLDFDPSFEWLMPRPLMMRYPYRQILNHFKSWVAGGLSPLGRKVLSQRMIEGESVAPPRSR